MLKILKYTPHFVFIITTLITLLGLSSLQLDLRTQPPLLLASYLPTETKRAYTHHLLNAEVGLSHMKSQLINQHHKSPFSKESIIDLLDQPDNSDHQYFAYWTKSMNQGSTIELLQTLGLGVYFYENKVIGINKPDKDMNVSTVTE